MKDFLDHIASGYAAQESDACIIANMHALPSVSHLFKIALTKGFSAENILFIGKPYSTIDTAKHEITGMRIDFASVLPQFPAGQLVPLHNQFLRDQLAKWCPSRRIHDFILLDSGGYLTKEFDQAFPHYKRVSVQLTSSGSRMWPLNTKQLVDLGSLDVKKSNESFSIAEAIYTEIEHRIDSLENRKICVIGNGVIGQNLSQSLAHRKIAHNNAIGIENPISVLNDYEVIIGATGYDVSALAVALSGNAEYADFISCSSWDLEFRELLLTTNAKVDLQSNSHGIVQVNDRITIHNGGCPINFNRKNEIEPERGIAVTRGLALAAMLGREIDDQAVARIYEAQRLHHPQYG